MSPRLVAMVAPLGILFPEDLVRSRPLAEVRVPVGFVRMDADAGPDVRLALGEPGEGGLVELSQYVQVVRAPGQGRPGVGTYQIVDEQGTPTESEFVAAWFPATGEGRKEALRQQAEEGMEIGFGHARVVGGPGGRARGDPLV